MKHLIFILALLWCASALAQPVNRIKLRQLQAAPDTVSQYFVASNKDTAEWVLVSTITGSVDTLTFAADSGTPITRADGETLTIAGAGIATTSASGSTITVTATEVDGSVTNEKDTVTTLLQDSILVYSVSGVETGRDTILVVGSGGGGGGGDNLGDHTATTNLNMDGNTILGGTGTTSDLILQTTSGVGATGADMFFLVGNNGGTEAMKILNNGNIGMGGASTPAQTLHVQGTARITGSDGTPTGLMGRDADGDISSAGSGTTNYVPKWTGAATLGNSLVYDNGTNVIIGGTTVPSITGAKILTLIGSGASAAGRAFLVCQTTNSTSATGAVFVNSSNRFAGMQYSSASYSGGESMSVFTAGDYPVDFSTNGANPFGGTSSIIFRPGGYLETPAMVAQSKKVSFGTSNTPRYTIDAGYTTDGSALPAGTTAQRPTGAAGVIRYNSTNSAFEGYGSIWRNFIAGQIGSASGTTDASGDFTVTHNLGTTPVQVLITNTDATTPRFLNVIAKGATTFTVRVFDSTGAAVNAGAYSIDWIAK